jgi:hypothetical protein
VRGFAIAAVDRVHGRAVDEVDAERRRVFGEEILEDAAVELVARRRKHTGDAELDCLVEVFAALAEEEAETELAQLALLEMVAAGPAPHRNSARRSRPSTRRS